MLPQTLEKHNLIELVCCFCYTCCLWLSCTFAFVLWLALIWVWCRAPIVVLNINIESGCLRWSPWEAFSNGFRLWLLLALLGLCMELIFFVGWLCLRMIREQQIEGAHYTLLGIRAHRAIEIVIIGTVEAYISLLDALLPCKSPRQEREDLYERQGRVGEKPQEVETV
ncbi:hypothetical protein F4782DRAFT_506888 [Xylaria castorea]|nr:hypothetical protein F4782DRAFT_506888 [Xylaria castorea]